MLCDVAIPVTRPVHELSDKAVAETYTTEDLKYLVRLMKRIIEAAFDTSVELQVDLKPEYAQYARDYETIANSHLKNRRFFLGQGF
jgi:hypothetical protein